MDNIIITRIEALNVRTVQETGLALKRNGRTFYTGTITSILDPNAFDNLAVFDFDAGTVKIRWTVLAMMPCLADACARGEIDMAEAAPVRVMFEEEGFLSADGTSFEVSGPGIVAPGSLFTGSIVASGNKGGCPPAPNGDGPKALHSLLSSNDAVALTFVPEASMLSVKLPDALGGGDQELNLVGGFCLRKVFTLDRTVGDSTTAPAVRTVAR